MEWCCRHVIRQIDKRHKREIGVILERLRHQVRGSMRAPTPLSSSRTTPSIVPASAGRISTAISCCIFHAGAPRPRLHRGVCPQEIPQRVPCAEPRVALRIASVDAFLLQSRAQCRIRGTEGTFSLLGVLEHRL